MLRISQNLSLQQKMAPQLIQSLQLLQMSTLELELEIKQQMELNPLLEEGLEQREEGDEGPEEAEGEEAPSVVEALKEEAEVPQNMEEQVNWDALLEDQFDRNSYNNESTEYDPNWEVDREPQENRITTLPPWSSSCRSSSSSPTWARRSGRSPSLSLAISTSAGT